MVSPTKTVTFGLCASIVLHAIGLVLVRNATMLPDVGLELTLPDSVEFGVYDGTPGPTPNTATPQPQPTNPPPSPTAPSAAQTPQPKREPGTQRQAPAHEARTEHPAPHEPDASAKAGALASFSPRGTQLALRLDLDRVRDSPLAEDVGALLAALPDVQLLLDGSGVVPMRDLSRLFLASPDLRRSHVVMAGRYVGDETLPRNAVESLARARGTQAPWRKARGIPVAAWQNADSTARVLALIGPGLFAITREEDLARVLAVARALAHRKQPSALSDAAAAQALVTMADGEMLGLAVENAKSFIRGPRTEQAPERLELSVRQAADRVEVDSKAEFTTPEQADAAERFWSHVRDQYAGHPLVALIGLDGVLRDTTFALHGNLLHVHSTLPVTRARLLIGFARDALNRPQPAVSSTRQGDSPPQE
jgi:hypothetical protein